MPRYHRVEDIIQLALALQVPGRGLCLEDIQQRFEVGRRTAERMREAVDRLYPGMTSVKGPDGRKYWSLPQGRANGLLAWQPDELEALGAAIACAERDGQPAHARGLRALRDKVESLAAGGVIEVAPADALDALEPLHRAILEDREVTFTRRGPRGEPVRVRSHPYGLLATPQPLLVAFHPDLGRARLHPVAGLADVVALDSGFERDPLIDLRRFAANACLPFEEGPVEVRWRFEGTAADEALEYEFHETQQLEARGDGSVELRFRADGLVELAWHLFVWGDRVKSLELPLDKHRFDLTLRRALEARLRASAEAARPDPDRA